MLVLGARRPRTVSQVGLAKWAIGRRSTHDADGVAGVPVTVLRGRKRKHGKLAIIFDGPRSGAGDLELGACRLHFPVRKR